MRRLLLMAAVLAGTSPAVAYLPPPEIIALEQSASLSDPVPEEFYVIEEHPEEPTDDIRWFRGYPPETWNPFPTVGEANCLDEQCLLNIVESALVTAVLYEFLIWDAGEAWFYYGDKGGAVTLGDGLPDEDFFRAEFTPVEGANEFRLNVPAFASAFQ